TTTLNLVPSATVGASITTTNVTGANKTYQLTPAPTNAANDASVDGSINVVSNSPPVFTNGPPTSPTTVGATYAFTYTFTGSPTPPFSGTWGALPPGLPLSPAGVIPETPTTQGTFSGVATASNTAGTNTQGFSITVNPAVSITTTTLSNWTANFPGYSQTVA